MVEIDLKGCTGIVTGGASGIGKVIVEKLLDVTASSLRYIEMIVVHGGMLDAGIPEVCVYKIMGILFPQEQEYKSGVI
mgnify:CR=1 FL=1